MIIVSDTSPLRYLVEIDFIGLLHSIFGSIVVPTQVITELSHPRTPQAVQVWVSKLPDWIDVREGDASRFPALGAGEAAAIALAIDLGVGLIVDELAARAVAERQGIKVIGTLGVLRIAGQQRLIDFPDALTKLRKTSFHMSDDLVEMMRQFGHESSGDA